MDDELKQLWNKDTSAENSVVDMSAMDSNKRSDLVYRIYKKLRFEHWFNIAFTIIFTAYLVYRENFITATIVMAIMLVIILYYHTLIKKVKNQTYTESVSDYVKDICGHLESFIKHYKILCYFLMPVSIYVGISLNNDLTISEILNSPKRIAIIISAIVFTIALVLFILRILYEKDVKKLREMIDELS
ncbi:MAG: hypothetical protein RJQ09_16400 [Cyclobacteriaceae bacterium]